MKFKDAYKRANDSVHVRPELLEQMKYQQAKERSEAAERRNGRRAWWVAIPSAAAATALACVAVFVGIRMTRSLSPAKTADLSNDFVLTDAALEESKAEAPASVADAGMALRTYDSYEAFAAQIQTRSEAFRRTEYSGGVIFNEAVDSADVPAAAEPMEMPVPEPMPTDAETNYYGSSNEYTFTDDVNLTSKSVNSGRSETGTNVQVQGVDEADIVKTDGTYLYCLNRENNKLYVVAAKGKDSEITASADLTKAKDTSSIDYSEMILANDRLYVIGTLYDWSANEANTENTVIEIYTLGDRTELKKVDTLKQQGSYRTSRLIGNTLVTVSAKYKYLWYYDIKNTDASLWCPTVTSDGNETMLAPDDLYINENSNESSSVLITTIDTATGKQFDSHKAVLGGCDVVYCNDTHLLIASDEYEREQSEEQTDANGKHFVRVLSREFTSLCLFNIEDGKITPVATQKLEGRLLNQFSMDAYNGSYRLVVTRNSDEETIWTDGIDTYDFKHLRDCALYTLDDALNPIGAVENLAADEMVQSVRFMGDVAYFVTFRQTDPLFAVDLSDPARPTILSELKIPGFSAYLHPFGEGKLLGIGYSADEKTGVTDGVKLSLFDISDPADVKVLEMTRVDASYITLQYNHKAVFVDVVTGTVAFPADNRYFVFSVDNAGFTNRGAIDIGEFWWGDGARGIMLGDAFYVVTNEAVVVLSFDTMKKLTEVKF